MKRSSNRILTTHVGSLIRPPALQEFLRAKQAGKPYDQGAYEGCLTEWVAEIVHKQAEVGIDVVSDGEFGKSISWSQYGMERLSGFERRPSKAGHDPFTRWRRSRAIRGILRRPRCARDGGARGGGDVVSVGPIAYTGQAEFAARHRQFQGGARPGEGQRKDFCRSLRRPAQFPTAR